MTSIFPDPAAQMRVRLRAITEEVLAAPVGSRGAAALRLLSLWNDVDVGPLDAQRLAQALAEEETLVMVRPDPLTWPAPAANTDDSPHPHKEQ